MLVQISWECTPPYLSIGISNLLQPAQAEVVLGQPSTYLASWRKTDVNRNIETKKDSFLKLHMSKAVAVFLGRGWLRVRIVRLEHENAETSGPELAHQSPSLLMETRNNLGLGRKGDMTYAV
jgi:hypothetical protein